MEERRSKQRFRLSLPMKFVSGSGRSLVEGAGTVVDVSSAGLAFRSNYPLALHTRVRAAVSWPALLNSECLLQLVVEGLVIRVDGTLTVMRIQQHEFRTGGRAKAEDVQHATQELGRLMAEPNVCGL
jgi:hypothetical protein